jgi:hypothetical protein
MEDQKANRSEYSKERKIPMGHLKERKIPTGDGEIPGPAGDEEGRLHRRRCRRRRLRCRHLRLRCCRRQYALRRLEASYVRSCRPGSTGVVL